MKSSLIPIACGTALALMTGAAATHWCAVRDLVALASAMPASRPALPASADRPSPAPMPDDRVAREARDLLAEVRGKKSATTSPGRRDARTPSFYAGHADREQAAERKPSRPPSGDPTEARIEKLLTALEGAVEQNQELRDRLADTNRDVMELRFQVDSYSGQFRPLKVEEEPTFYDDGSGVLPPLDAP